MRKFRFPKTTEQEKKLLKIVASSAHRLALYAEEDPKVPLVILEHEIQHFERLIHRTSRWRKKYLDAQKRFTRRYPVLHKNH